MTFGRAPGGAFTLESAVWLPRPRDELFPFFSAAENLGRITPPILGWRILTPLPVVMRAGALIDYRILVHGLPMRWRTLISAWEPSSRFVDEQVKGPYRRWRHEHSFEPLDGGTLCRDHIEYTVPFAFLSHRWIVRPDLLRIFTHRQERMRELFNPGSGPPSPLRTPPDRAGSGS